MSGILRENICNNCGITFNSKKLGVKYCSEKCNKEYHNYCIKEKEILKKVCVKCGSEFETLKNQQIYCSKECQNIVNKDKYNEKKKITNFKIYERDNFKCIYCGKSSIEDGVELEVDHIYPKGKGGGNDIFNLATICTLCNGSQGKWNKLLKREIILRIWERNMKLSEDGIEKYDELVKYFNQIYKPTSQY